MDKQKQIEEMAKVISVNCGECYTCKYRGAINCVDFLSAEELYNAGYRKIPEGAVVVSRAEYNDLKGLEKHFDDYLIKEIVATRKETAEKFARLASEAFLKVNCIDLDEWDWYRNKIDEICKEITEGVYEPKIDDKR